MFTTFFKGSVDDLLNHVQTAPNTEIENVDNPNKILHREEIIDLIIEDLKVNRQDAERMADEILMEEFNRIIQPMLEKGIVEVVDYDADGLPIYKPVS